MSFKFASAFAALAIAAAALAPAPAMAKTPASSAGVTYTIAIAYGDLDLTRAKDVKKLNVRLDRALNRVCGDARDKSSLGRRHLIKACREDARSLAMASIQTPMVLAALQGGVTG
jgi:UrcA family protein